MFFARKLIAILAMLTSAHAANASLILNGGFEALDLNSLARGTPNLISTIVAGRPANIILGLPGGASIPGWTTEGTRSDLINNNIGSNAIAGAYWPAAYEGSQYLYLNAWGNTSTSIYQTLNLTGGTSYSLGFYLNGLIGATPLFDGLHYHPQVSVSILDASLSPIFQMLATGVSNTAWTAINADFSVVDSGIYRLVFSAPTDPVLPSGQRQNFIALDEIALVDIPVVVPPPVVDPQQPVPVPATLWCVLVALLAMGIVSRKSLGR